VDPTVASHALHRPSARATTGGADLIRNQVLPISTAWSRNPGRLPISAIRSANGKPRWPEIALTLARRRTTSCQYFVVTIRGGFSHGLVMQIPEEDQGLYKATLDNIADSFAPF